MKRDLRFVLISLIFTAMLSVIAFGQETTGGIEITAKDTNGAIVPGVTLTVTSTHGTVGFKQTVTANADGFARLVGVPWEDT